MKAMVLKPTQKTSTRDNIGNRTSTTNNSEATSYSANQLNQYTNIADGVTNTPTYDADGNMLTNGEWTYAWNGENRMVLASNASHVITFAYDFQGRCYEKVKDGVTNSYVWDDFNIITEVSSAHTNQNVWGLDLSGSMQGAGGVGGLLSVATINATTNNCYYTASDANGNICQYVDASGTTVANREYSPFGKTIALTGSKKDDFTHWFSTKPWDADTEMSEYEYRKYLAEIGRWLSRDPIGEIGGLNLFHFVFNNALGIIDKYGLSAECNDCSSFDCEATQKRINAMLAHEMNLINMIYDTLEARQDLQPWWVGHTLANKAVTGFGLGRALHGIGSTVAQGIKEIGEAGAKQGVDAAATALARGATKVGTEAAKMPVVPASAPATARALNEAQKKIAKEAAKKAGIELGLGLGVYGASQVAAKDANLMDDNYWKMYLDALGGGQATLDSLMDMANEYSEEYENQREISDRLQSRYNECCK